MSDDIIPAAKRRRIINSTTNSKDNIVPVLNLDKNIYQTAGRIEKITLKNVQCHSHLTVELNECVNLIQGKNGSGKSSIVAAIIAGFGGSSASADKGKTFRNLIQTGKQHAVIQICLNNIGINAYQQDVFGDKIIVERKIAMNGNGSYKLKDNHGAVISCKKDELNKILYKFNIMVDNPVVVLSQEKAKTFLSTATPENLFKFYMHSTGMHQVKTDYENIKSNCSHCDMLIQMKIQNLQTLAKDVIVWERKAHAHSTLEKKRRKVTYLKIEKVVSEVNELTLSLNTFNEQKNRSKSKLEKIENKIKIMETEKNGIAKDKKKRDDESENIILQANELKARKDSIHSDIAKQKLSLKKLLSEMREFEKKTNNKQADIDSIRKEINEDRSVVYQLWAEKNANLIEQKEQNEIKLQELKKMLQVSVTHGENLQNTSELFDECNHLRNDCQALKQRLSKLQFDIRGIKERGNNSLLVFDTMMPQIVDDIERACSQNRFTTKPVGPVGAFLKCKEQKWMHIAEKICSPVIQSFLVCCKDDFTMLKGIFNNRIRDRRQPKIIVIKFRDKLLDTTRYAVRSEYYQSLWSILDVSNIHAANVLIDHISVENILLIPTSQEAGELLKDANSVPVNCKKAYTLNGDLYYPDPKFRIYSGDGNNKIRFLQVSTQQMIKELQESERFTKEEVLKSEEDVRNKLSEMKQITDETKRNKDNQTKYKAAIHRLERNLNDLKDKEEPAPQDIFQLQTELKEYESVLQEIEEKKQEIENKVLASREHLQETSEKFKVMSIEADKHVEDVYKIQNFINQANARHQKILVDLRKLKDMKLEHQKTIEDTFSKNIKKLEDDIRAKTSELQAINNSTVETNRSVCDIERELNSLENAIHEEESKIGDINIIVDVLKEKTANYEQIKKYVAEQKSYIKTLKKSITSRERLLVVLKIFNETYIKSCFNKAIQKRNLKGDLNIDHDAKLLKITVQKAGEGTNSKMRPLSMMSGGEKSFATVSFIIALWDVINSPIRVLDEFDVFMDDVARRQVTDLMLSSIKNEYQYIFITPLDYSRKASQFNIITMNPPRD